MNNYVVTDEATLLRVRLVNMTRERDEARAHAARLREALESIRCKPDKPFPDMGAHLPTVFDEAVWLAWTDVQRIAYRALAKEHSQLPEEPDRTLVETTLVEILREHLKNA